MANKKNGSIIIIALVILAAILINGQKPQIMKQAMGTSNIVYSQILTPTISNDQNLKAEVILNYDFNLGSGYIVEAGIVPPNYAQTIATTIVGPSSNCDYELMTENGGQYPTKFFENAYERSIIQSAGFSKKYTFIWDTGLMDSIAGKPGLTEGTYPIYLSVYKVPDWDGGMSFREACLQVRNAWSQSKTSIFQHQIGTFTITKQTNTCSDSDEGKNYFVEGNVQGNNNGENFIHYDTCLLDDKTVREWFCSDNKYVYEDYVCSNGCDIQKNVCLGGSSTTTIPGPTTTTISVSTTTTTTPDQEPPFDIDKFLKTYGVWLIIGFALLVFVMIIKKD